MLLAALAADAQVTTTTKEIRRDEPLTFTVTNPPPGIYTKVTVKLVRPNSTEESIDITPVSGATPPASYTAVSRAMRYGMYDLIAIHTADGKKTEINTKNAFKVVAAAAPHIAAVDPTVTYPENKHKLTVVGSDFSSIPADNALEFVDRAFIPACDDVIKTKCISVTEASPRQLVFLDNLNVLKGLAGPQKIRVHVGTLASDAEPVSLTVSRVQRTTPLRLAGVITIAILLVLVSTLLAGRSSMPERKYSLLAMAFLDMETNTYSLSKAQFYAWTFAAVFGYFFLTLAKWLVQGVFEMADVPENLPSIIMISAGTATLATGVNSARPKGSGATKPSIGDFATSGGVVAPDRVQFLVWTIVGFLAFMGLLLQSEPGTINKLPKIPEGFLYLMGISAAGYLGGKLARQPGPKVTSATGTHDGATTYTVEVTGSNLSPDAFVYLDEVRILPEWLNKNSAGAAAPDVVLYEDDRRYAKQLRYPIQKISAPQGGTITFPSGPAKEKFRLVLINPDGQRSEYQAV